MNDSARAMMAATAKFRDDISGAIVTGGTSTAYTVTSYQVFNSLANMNGQMIAFTPHATNTAGSPNITLNVDGLGAKTIQSSPGVDIPAGVLIQGTPYVVIYNQTNGVFYLQNFFGNPYNIPIGGMLDFIGTTAPNSSLVLPFGQAISRTTYATLFALVGTTYGSGDGSTTFGLPDCRGRVIAGKDDMGGVAAGRLSGTSITTGGATTLGGTGGSETKTLVTANLPPYTPAGTVTGSINSNSLKANMRTNNSSGANDPGVLTQAANGGTNLGQVAISGGGGDISGTLTGTPQGGTSTAFAITQPTIVANKLLRII